ncbi:hypothetical protein AB0M43_37685 [Longispora sp. NPDC051575]|uniref:hypothetical protein n=1 Tax=Longispora sp. NPDC051575 TaxID=3154943 RepID=UPI003433C5CF
MVMVSRRPQVQAVVAGAAIGAVAAGCMWLTGRGLGNRIDRHARRVEDALDRHERLLQECEAEREEYLHRLLAAVRKNPAVPLAIPAQHIPDM